MSKTSEKFQAIADSIRSVNGKTDKYTPDQMPNAINELNSGYTMTLEGTTLKLTDSKGNVQSVNVVADTSELEKKVQSNADRFGGLRFSLTEAGLLHIEEAS